MKMPWAKKPLEPQFTIKNESGEDVVFKLNDTSLRSQIAGAISGGYDWADTLHNVYTDYGYPETVTFSNCWNMYRRFGIAKNIVELPVDTGWMTRPEIEGLNDEFERMADRTKFWLRVKALDTRQRVGRYAGMFMRVRDGQSPDKPIETKGSGEGFLVAMTPLYEGQLKVLTTETNPASENYGLPTMYQFIGNGPGGRSEYGSGVFSIHPSRIVIAAEGADNGGIYGIPALEAAYNSLMDLRKIIGAGGEGFYKNAAQSVIFQLEDAASAKQNATLLEKFNDNYDAFSKNRMRRGLWTPGLRPTVLESSLANPKDFFASALNDVAAAAQIPATILIGQQTGRLASSEDSRHFLAMVNSRRENFQSDLIGALIDWLMQYGVIRASDYEIMWDDLLALSDSEKLDAAQKMAEINQKQFLSGGGAPFTGEEIREMAGYELEDFEMGSEELPEDEI